MAELATPLRTELKVVLEGEQSRLRKSLGWLGEAEQVLGESLDATIEQAERWQLSEVEEALRRMAEGRYGTCEECHQPIEQGQLIALPWTRFCLARAIRRRQANQSKTVPLFAAPRQ
jgi:RNA polymerase-binding transcription factor DksA